MSATRHAEKREVLRWIYTAKIKLRNGKIIYAHQYGLKAFRIPVYA